MALRLLVALGLALACADILPGAAQEVGAGESAGSRAAQNASTQCITYISPNVPVDVPTPPDTAGIVNSTLTVPHTFTITDVNVGPLNVTHTFVRDLDMVLFSPAGTSIQLFDEIGALGADDITDLVLDDEAAEPVASQPAPFTGTFRPVASLSAFDGQSSFGIWRLQVTDDAPEDVGVLNAWSLQLCGFPGTNVVVPNALAAAEGNSENTIPFGWAQPVRYQQVYDASQLPRHPARITQIAFRPDGETGAPFSTTGLDVEIRLAHTDGGVNALDNAFANNLDRNVTLVYDGPLHLHSADSGGPPRDFDVVIGLNQTFVYNGADNLLLEVKIFSQPSATFFDAVESSGVVSRIEASDPNATQANPAGGNDVGLVTRFTMDADTDSDGCIDTRERGANAALGGQRDPKLFWDFFDTPGPANVRDAIIATGDVLRVAQRFGTTGNPGGNPLTTPPPSGYHTAFDRSPPSPGADRWDLNPADGAVTIGDIFLSVAQFGHSCVP